MNFSSDSMSRRQLGLQVRTEVIKHFTSDDFLETLVPVISANELARSRQLPDAVQADRILEDMTVDSGWAEEFWTIDDAGAVHLVDRQGFEASAVERRFSNSDTLRVPRADAFALRGLLSGLHSTEVSQAFSEAAGVGGVGYKSADIARYRPGHYLRRHDDVYDGRLFGLVFFVHDTWARESGTHLIAENPDGRCQVVSPAPRSVAIMRLAGGHFHQVQPNTSSSWDRYSIAVHFGLKNE